MILPGNSDTSLEIRKAEPENGYEKFESVWRSEDGFDGEPLIDVQRLEASDVLSVFTRTKKGSDGSSKVIVLDFLLTDAALE